MNQRIFATLVFICLFTFGLFAQKLEVREVNEKMSQGSHNGLSIMLYEVDQKDVEDECDKWIRKELNANTKTKKGEIYGSEAEHKDMGELPFEVYAVTKEEKEGTRLTIFVNLGGAYLSSGQHKDRFQVMKELLREFAVDLTKEAIEDELDDAEDQLKDLKKDQEDLVDDKEDLQKDIKKSKKEIEDCKETIKEEEKNIEKAEKKIEETEKEIEKQKSKVTEQQKEVAKIEEKLNKVK